MQILPTLITCSEDNNLIQLVCLQKKIEAVDKRENVLASEETY